MPEPTRTDRARGEIDWPDWADRTPTHRRVDTSKYRVTMGQAISEIADEMDRLGADNWRLSTAAPHRKRDGLPYADANPDDPGVVVHWTNDGADYAVPCDHYTDLLSNARTIGLYLEEKRKMEDRPVHTVRSEFYTAREQLPPGDEEDAIVTEPRMTDQEAASLLNVTPDSPSEVVERAFQVAVKSEHPDQGGHGDVDRLKNARDQLLNE